MDAASSERLTQIMARMAGGDEAAVFTLYEEFGSRLAAVVRRHLARLGVEGIGRDELDGLVIDACLALAACAAGWRPDGGALPWQWADRRLAALVSAYVGQHADELGGDEPTAVEAPPPSASWEPPPLEILLELGAQRPVAAMLVEGMDLVGRERDRRLLLEVALQTSLGDPSPAATVAGFHGMQPAAVRQAVKRMKDRLRRLAADEPRFAPLADLALLS